MYIVRTGSYARVLVSESQHKRTNAPPSGVKWGVKRDEARRMVAGLVSFSEFDIVGW